MNERPLSIVEARAVVASVRHGAVPTLKFWLTLGAGHLVVNADLHTTAADLSAIMTWREKRTIPLEPTRAEIIEAVSIVAHRLWEHELRAKLKVGDDYVPPASLTDAAVKTIRSVGAAVMEMLFRVKDEVPAWTQQHIGGAIFRLRLARTLAQDLDDARTVADLGEVMRWANAAIEEAVRERSASMAPRKPPTLGPRRRR